MMTLWTTLAALALALFVGAHATLLVMLVRGRGIRALPALLLPPLAPWWGWEDGRRTLCAAWCTGVVLYALVVALA